MSKKIRLTLTQTVEYVPRPEFYDGAETIEEMAQLDANAEEWEVIFYNAPVRIEWEVLEDGEVVTRGKRQVAD